MLADWWLATLYWYRVSISPPVGLTLGFTQNMLLPVRDRSEDVRWACLAVRASLSLLILLIASSFNSSSVASAAAAGLTVHHTRDEAGYTLRVPLAPESRWLERSSASAWNLRVDGVNLFLDDAEPDGRPGGLQCVNDVTGCELRMPWPYRYVTKVQPSDDGGTLLVRLDARYRLVESEVLAPEIEYRLIKMANGLDPVVVHQVLVRAVQTAYRLKPALMDGPHDALQPLARLAASHSALVGINAGYFAMGSASPLGLLVRNRQILAMPLFDRSALLLDESNRASIGHTQAAYHLKLPHGESLDVDALNRLPGQHQLTVIAEGRAVPRLTESTWAMLRDSRGVLTPLQTEGLSVPAGHVLLLATGQCADWLKRRVQAGDRLDLENTLLTQWPAIEHVLAAGPRLLENGQVAISGAREQFKPDVVWGRAPRSALGILKDGSVLIVSVDGRMPGISHGMTLVELATHLQSEGALDALNLDGGGSTTLYVRDRVVNHPSDGTERPIHNALLLVKAD